MTKYQCASCKGTYESDQDLTYYHRCPPGTRNPRDENVQTVGWKQDSDGEEKLIEESKIEVVAGRAITKLKSEGLGRNEVVSEPKDSIPKPARRFSFSTS